MVWLFRDENEAIESDQLDEKKIKALSDQTRRNILEVLAEDEMYPLEVARQLGVEKQKTYYHFNKLENADLIKKTGEASVSGGTATLYKASAPSFYFDTGKKGEKNYSPSMNQDVKQFLNPIVKEGEFNGSIVVGSPEEHGPDRVQARDGHLAGEIGLEIGKYVESDSRKVALDTEIVRDDRFDESMIMIGGVLTNTVTRKFNDKFPASFEGESFPYREIQTPEASYSDEAIGVVAKTDHPKNSDRALIMVAGVRNSGTEAAVLAFKKLENLLDNYSAGDFYTIVRGLDMDGDGEIDDFEVIE